MTERERSAPHACSAHRVETGRNRREKNPVEIGPLPFPQGIAMQSGKNGPLPFPSPHENAPQRGALPVPVESAPPNPELSLLSDLETKRTQFPEAERPPPALNRQQSNRTRCTQKSTTQQRDSIPIVARKSRGTPRPQPSIPPQAGRERWNRNTQSEKISPHVKHHAPPEGLVPCSLTFERKHSENACEPKNDLMRNYRNAEGVLFLQLNGATVAPSTRCRIGIDLRHKA